MREVSFDEAELVEGGAGTATGVAGSLASPVLVGHLELSQVLFGAPEPSLSSGSQPVR